jgi:hypothetical protein
MARFSAVLPALLSAGLADQGFLAKNFAIASERDRMKEITYPYRQQRKAGLGERSIHRELEYFPYILKAA